MYCLFKRYGLISIVSVFLPNHQVLLIKYYYYIFKKILIIRNMYIQNPLHFEFLFFLIPSFNQDYSYSNGSLGLNLLFRLNVFVQLG